MLPHPEWNDHVSVAVSYLGLEYIDEQPPDKSRALQFVDLQLI